MSDLKYSWDLNYRLVRYSNGSNGCVLRPPFGYRTINLMLVWILVLYLDTCYHSTGHLNCTPLEYRTSKSLVFRCLCFSDVPYSYPRCKLNNIFCISNLWKTLKITRSDYSFPNMHIFLFLWITLMASIQARFFYLKKCVPGHVSSSVNKKLKVIFIY